MSTATADSITSPSGPGPKKRGVQVSDWKIFAAVAGGSFFANLVALITVVQVMLAPVKISLQNNADRIAEHTEDIKVFAEELHDHERTVGHDGMIKLIERVEAQLVRLESGG